ncbi:hypothetical protein GETHPA_22030 [Geothrix rubra]|uniref:O-antigen ligase-related domain-containing protein n=1 Tax=Geothrix rubra TaxID=2927977 RepID=A0ABQ5Q978_9BACT|nr:hypothetical protein GETHPA_22030 [Geothrix rubra]
MSQPESRNRNVGSSVIRENQIFLKLVGLLKLILLLLVVISFSTDIRLSSGLSVDPNARPTFQLFEFFAIPLFFILMAEWLIEQKRSKLFLKTDLLFLSFVVWASLISWNAYDPYHALSRAKDFFLAWVLFASVRGLNSDQLRKVMVLVMILAVGWSLFGAMQMLQLDPWFGSDFGKLFKIAVSWKTVVNPITGEMKDSAFAQGIYLYPQDFTYYILMPLFLFAGLAKRNRRWIPLFILVLAAMVGSGSKTFYVMVLLYFMWAALRRLKIQSLPAILMCATAVVSALVVGTFALNPEYYMEAIGTLVWRFEQWSDTINMLFHAPYVFISGHGTEYLQQNFSRFNYPNPHNACLYFLIEYGVIGFFLMACFMWFSLRGCHSRLRVLPAGAKDTQGTSWITGLEPMMYSGLLFTLAMAILDDYFVQTQLTALFMFYLGVLSGLLWRVRVNAPRYMENP